MPNNAGYYHAAYAVVAVVYGAYALSLWVRRRRAQEKLGRGGR
ncbi:MAG TPA: hypothetical protein VIC55_00680 [Gemmatimonadaceae bacterium]|jgi:hypothetical protein